MNPEEASLRAVARRPNVYRYSAVVVRFLARVYFRLRILGAEQVPPLGPVILASNHVSFLDPPLIGAFLPRKIHFLARKTLFDLPVIGWFCRQLQAVPVDRDGGGGAGLKAILDRLEAGAGILLFPEGTRSPDGEVKSARAGIGMTVIKSKAPVIPVRLFGAFEAMGRHQKFPRPHRITIVLGAPMQFEKLRAEAATCDKARLKEIYQEIADQLMDAIRGLKQD